MWCVVGTLPEALGTPWALRFFLVVLIIRAGGISQCVGTVAGTQLCCSRISSPGAKSPLGCREILGNQTLSIFGDRKRNGAKSICGFGSKGRADCFGIELIFFLKGRDFA